MIQRTTTKGGKAVLLCLRYVNAVVALSELGVCLRGVRRRSRFKTKPKRGKTGKREQKNCPIGIDLEKIISPSAIITG